MTTDYADPLLQQDFTAAKNGDRTAFARLVVATQRMVTSVALAITRDLQNSEDIAQDTFLRAWQRIGLMQHADSLLPWLRHVARNLAIDHVRKRRYAEAPHDPSDDRIAQRADARPDPAESLAAAQQHALLMRALDEIPDDSREVLLLFYREGQSSRTVATLLGLSDAAVRKRLQRARDALQTRLEAFGAAAERSAPGTAFTAAVSAALGASPNASAAAAGGGGSMVAKLSGKWLLGAVGSTLAAVGLMLAAVVWEVRRELATAKSARQHRALLRLGILYGIVMATFVCMLGWASHAQWERSTTLLAAGAYSLVILLIGVRRHYVHRGP